MFFGCFVENRFTLNSNSDFGFIALLCFRLYGQNEEVKLKTERQSSIKGRDRNGKFVALALILGLLGGLLGGTIGITMLVPSGPAGPQGEKGNTGDIGDTGPQGLQGVGGVNGTDSILQIVQQRNDSQIDTISYNATRWYNLSVVDPSMRVVINVQQDSRIFVQFSGVQSLEPPASIWVRIMVDDVLNSSRYVCSIGPSSSMNGIFSGHVEFLTVSLNAGSHVVDVQFYRQTGNPVMLDRTLTVMEISA